MKVVALYRPNSEFARLIEEYARDFEQRRGKTLELVSLDTVEGADMARLYGIMQYPALLVIKDDGQLLKDWQGDRLPLMDEVAGYLNS
jgi:hypothetical protein